MRIADPAPPAHSYDDRRFAPALMALMGTVFVNLVGFGLIVPLLPFFAGALHAAGWQVTLMFAAYSLGQFFAEPFWGRLSDRIGRKPVLMITTGLNAVGYLALAFAPDIWWAIGIRLATGLGAGNISTVQGYVADITAPEKRAGRMGVIGAAFGLGFIVGPALGGALAGEGATREAYQLPLYLASGLAAAASLAVLAFLKESRSHAAPPPSPLAALGFATGHPVVSRVLLVTLIYMGAFSGMEATYGLWAAAKFGWGAREVGWTFAVVGIVSVLFQGFLTGRLARRFGEARVLAFGMVTFGLSLTVQTLNPVPILTPVIMAFGAAGMALAMPNISAMISRSTPGDRQGSVLGLNMATGSLARIVGPLVAGVTFTSLNHNAPFWTATVLVLPAALMAINAGRAMKRQREADAAAVAEPALVS